MNDEVLLHNHPSTTPAASTALWVRNFVHLLWCSGIICLQLLFLLLLVVVVVLLLLLLLLFVGVVVVGVVVVLLLLVLFVSLPSNFSRIVCAFTQRP
jgi:hypothetical protein